MKRPLLELVYMLLLAAILAVMTIGAVTFDARLAKQVHAEPVADFRPLLYVISVSRESYAYGDAWLVQYALDGRPYAVDVPIEDGEPAGYLTYLKTIGRME